MTLDIYEIVKCFHLFIFNKHLIVSPILTGSASLPHYCNPVAEGFVEKPKY